MKQNIEINGEDEENKKQNLNFESEIFTQQNSFLDIFDTNIISKIFSELTIPIISEEQEEQQDYKCCFLNCISFSLTSKIFNSISKQLKFSIPIFNQEKIENIDFNIYLKLNCLLQQETCLERFIKNETYETKEELLNYILMYTSQNGIYDLIPILILNGANVNDSTYGENPLRCSCRYGYYKTSKVLIEYNAKIKSENYIGQNILFEACGGGILKLVKYLIDEKKCDFQSKDDQNQSILFEASSSGNLELVKYLIDEKKLDINLIDLTNQNILFNSCYYRRNIELVKYLIDEKKLNFNLKDIGNQNILFNSCNSGSIELVKYLIDEKKLDINLIDLKNQNVLFKLCYFGDLELVKYLIDEKKLNFNLKDIGNQNILFNSCNSGNIELVKYLIEEKKLDFNILDKDGGTILFKAVHSRNIELIDYLLSFVGFNINHKNSNGHTLLYWSCTSGRKLETMKYLISKGADLEIKYNGRNLLQVATRARNPINTIEELKKYFD